MTSEPTHEQQTATMAVTLTAIPSPTTTKTPKPTVTSTATQEPFPTYLPVFQRTPTGDLSSFKGVWNQYSNEVYRFTFEYPAIYDVVPYEDCGVKVEDEDGAIFIMIGFESTLEIKQSDLSLDKYVDRVIEDHYLFHFGPKVEKSINGVRAIELWYDVPNQGLWTATFLKRDSYVFGFGYWHGETCDIPDVGVEESLAYDHMIASLRFEP